MRHRTALIMVAFILAEFTAGGDVCAQELWKLVAQSHLIVLGVPSAPEEEIAESRLSGNHRYLDIPVRVVECLKGTVCTGKIVMRYFTRPTSFSPAPQTLLDSSGKPSVLFLVQVDDISSRGLYFAGHTSATLQAQSEPLIQDIRSEVESQQQILGAFPRLFPPEKEPLYPKVMSVIEEALHRDTQANAFAELEALGEAGVPAMIMLMDDRRPLPLRQISLKNKSPQAFEGLRHYGPQVVVDAIAAILNQVTGDYFGQIMNGGSERERQAEIQGWRVYLYRKQYGSHNPALQRPGPKPAGR